MNAASLVEKAIARRKSLLDRSDLNALRVFNGAPDGVPGLVVERFGDLLIVQCHEGRLQADKDTVRSIASLIHARLETKAVYRKHFVRDRAHPGPSIQSEHTDAKPWMGKTLDEEIVVVEYGLSFRIRPYDGFSVGLFLDHRENRRRIGELAAGKRVLNLFSYTCAFSVAAAAGGADTVSSVDLSKRYLEWGKRNFQANGLSLDGHLFFCSDVFDFFKRATRQGRRYDLLIIDPPSFGRAGKGKDVFVLEEDLEKLCTGAVALLDPGGYVFLASNHRQLGLDRLETALRSAVVRGTVEILAHPSLPPDFEGDPDYAKTVIARVH